MKKSKQENSEKKKDATKAKTTKAPKTALKRVAKVLLVILFIFTLVQLSKRMEDSKILSDLDDPMIGEEVAGLYRVKRSASPPSCFMANKPGSGFVEATYRKGDVSEKQALENIKVSAEYFGWQNVHSDKTGELILLAEKNEMSMIAEVESDLVKILIYKLYNCPLDLP